MGPNIETVSDISLEVTKIIEKHDTVDWQTNKDIHNKIAQDIDDLLKTQDLSLLINTVKLCLQAGGNLIDS